MYPYHYFFPAVGDWLIGDGVLMIISILEVLLAKIRLTLDFPKKN